MTTPIGPEAKEGLAAWAARLDIASEVIRRRATDAILVQAAETVERVAEEMRYAARHVSTWPAPGGDDVAE